MSVIAHGKNVEFPGTARQANRATIASIGSAVVIVPAQSHGWQRKVFRPHYAIRIRSADAPGDDRAGALPQPLQALFQER